MASCPRVEAERNVAVVESAGEPNSTRPFDAGAEDARSHFQDQGDAQPSLPGFSEAEGKGRPSVYQRDSASARSIHDHSYVGHSKCSAGAAESPSPRSRDSKKFSKVRFDAQPITAIWPAHTSKEYDRRSIVVDLSKTPFALFRKDAVLMKTATASATAPSAPLPRPSPAALAVSYQIPDAPQKSPVSSTSQEMQVTGSEDSDTSDSSIGHTDTETDLDPSDSDSSPRSSKKMPGLRKSIADVKPAYFGVWKRTSSEGYEELLLSSGVPKKAAVMAMRKHPVHIIDHDGAYFRLIVKNGLSKIDNTFFIGDEPRVDKVGKRIYKVSLNWGDVSGYGSQDDLILSSICDEEGEEVIAIRSLVEDGTRMVLTQIVRRMKENYEVQAKHFFKRVTNKSELQIRGVAPSSKVIAVRMERSSSVP